LKRGQVLPGVRARRCGKFSATATATVTDTRAGRIALEIPKLRKGSYFPSFLEPRRTAGKALVALAIVARSNGVSMARSRRPVSMASRRALWSRADT